jgi:hypothetical protein
LAGSLAALFLVGISKLRNQYAIPIAGILIASAAALALSSIRPIPSLLLLGLALLALAGLVSSTRKHQVAWGIALALPGAYLVALMSDIPGRPWVSWLVLGAIVLGSAFATDFDKRYKTGRAALFLAMTIGGVFLTVPDTEEILVLLGAALPVLVLAWPRPLVRFGFGIFPLVGILIWAITWGGRGREGSIVGAVGCLGVLLVEPLASLIGRRTVRLPGLEIAALHLMLVLIGARIAGLRENPVTGASIAALALVIGTACCWILIRRADPRIRT